MSKEIIIDPEWEAQNRLRGKWGSMPKGNTSQDDDSMDESENIAQEPVEPEISDADREFTTETVSPSKVKEYIGSFLSGSILTKAEVKRMYPYMLFIAFLLLLYISGIFRTQQLYRQRDDLTLQVKEYRARAMTLSSIKMKATRQSYIIEEIERRGLNLKESLIPPKTLE